MFDSDVSPKTKNMPTPILSFRPKFRFQPPGESLNLPVKFLATRVPLATWFPSLVGVFSGVL